MKWVWIIASFFAVVEGWVYYHEWKHPTLASALSLTASGITPRNWTEHRISPDLILWTERRYFVNRTGDTLAVTFDRCITGNINRVPVELFRDFEKPPR